MVIDQQALLSSSEQLRARPEVIKLEPKTLVNYIVECRRGTWQGQIGDQLVLFVVLVGYSSGPLIKVLSGLKFISFSILLTKLGL